tara:strand:+ start:241 stop:579 length:339 start_codon:yes stop_codon:yes gene_type:complete
MATNAQWTVIFDDKKIIKQSLDTEYVIDDNDFWGLAKWNNIWAIQYGTSNSSDTVEYRDATPHSTWEDANLGDFQDFITRWDAAHLEKLQSDWDTDERDESEKGPRPTSYSS